VPGARSPRLVALVAIAAVVVTVAACSGDDDAAGFRPMTTVSTEAARSSTAVPTTRPRASTTTSTSSTTSTSTSTSTTTTTIDPLTVRHAFPVDPSVTTSWTPEAHANYRATDVFASTNCGTHLLAPVDGVVDEVQENHYDRATDDPALRGGNAVAIIGDDGVRYYMAHFQAVDPAIVAGARVEAGQLLGEMGETGRAGACHVHFGLSLPCPDNPDDWWVRRGVIWPDRYLQAWKDGENLSPLPELQEWFAQYPDACRSLEDTPYPRG